jgi:hypothetical protein
MKKHTKFNQKEKVILERIKRIVKSIHEQNKHLPCNLQRNVLNYKDDR